MKKFILQILTIAFAAALAIYGAVSASAQGESGGESGESNQRETEAGDSENDAGNPENGDSKSAETGGEEKKPGTADPELGKYTRRGFVRMLIPNGRITGNTSDKLYHVEGGLEVYYFNVMLKGDTADIDQNNETVTIIGNVFVEDLEYRINCETVDVDYNNNWLKAQGFVQFERYNLGIARPREGDSKKTRMLGVFKNQKTKVYCGNLEYNWDSEDFHATGEVKVVQDEITIEAEEVKYDSAIGAYLLSGNVTLVIEKFGWLNEAGMVEQEDKDVAAALTKSKVTLTADYIAINEETGVIKCMMNQDSEKQVVLDQSDKKLECDDLEINDTTQLFKAAGNVKYWQQNGNWLIEGGLIKRNEADEQVLKEIANPMTMTTELLTFDYDKRRMESKSELVKIEGSKGKYAECSEMAYDDKEKVLTMGGGVSIVDGKEFIYCDSLRADTNKKIYEFFGGVDGFFMYEGRDSGTPAADEKTEPTPIPGSEDAVRPPTQRI